MIFDDVPSIVYNRSIRSLTPLTEVLLPPTDTGVLRRPLVNLTLALNFQISQLRVWSYHLLNLIIHLLAALTLTGVMIHLLKQDHFQGRYRYSGGWLSLTIAAVWMLHPLQTESVTYIIQRCESLMGLLYLLTLLCAVKGWHSQRPALWHGAAIIFAILGIAAKEVMVTAPIMVLAFDCFFNRRSILQAMKDSKLLYFGLFFTWAPLAWLTMRGGGGGAIADGFEHPALMMWLTLPKVILHYWRLIFWPNALILDYWWFPVSHIREALPGMVVGRRHAAFYRGNALEKICDRSGRLMVFPDPGPYDQRPVESGPGL